MSDTDIRRSEIDACARCGVDYSQVVDCRVYDALRWVAQEAKAAMMAQDLNRGRLREALKALEKLARHDERPTVRMTPVRPAEGG